MRLKCCTQFQHLACLFGSRAYAAVLQCDSIRPYSISCSQTFFRLPTLPFAFAFAEPFGKRVASPKFPSLTYFHLARMGLGSIRRSGFGCQDTVILVLLTKYRNHSLLLPIRDVVFSFAGNCYEIILHRGCADACMWKPAKSHSR
jgi:hypothetical protein